MTGRFVQVLLWLFAGHLVLGGLYWLLVIVPESNVLMLLATALLAILLVVGFGVVETTGLLRLRPDWTWRQAIARSLRALPAFLLAAAFWLAVRWICIRLARSHALHRGEIDAWLIAAFDWTRTAWLHQAIDVYFLGLLRYIVAPSLALSLLAAAAIEGFGAIARPRWFVRALSPRQLGIILLAVGGLIWLPWRAVYWRPTWLPETSVELPFVTVKLLAIGALMHAGWTLILWAAQRGLGRPEPAAPVIPNAKEVAASVERSD